MDYSYIRDDFNFNSISKSILSIQLSLDGFSFVINPVSSPDSPEYIYINAIENGTPLKLSEELTKFTGFDGKEFLSIRIIHHDPFFTLVPQSVFDLKDMKTYMNFNHPKTSDRKILTNDIPPANAVTVFSIDQSLYKILKNKFPGADFYHSSLPFISHGIQMEENACFIQIFKNSMELAVIKNKKLELYNIFELSGENDIVYFTLNAFKSSKLDTMVNSLHISGTFHENSEAIELLKKYIADVRIYSPDYKIDNEGLKYHPYYFLNHREILNCEL